MQSESLNYTTSLVLTGEISPQTITLRLRLALAHVQQAQEAVYAAERLLKTLLGEE